MNQHKPLVLIIDDVPENIQVLLQILERQDYRFAVATSAEEGLKSVESEKPDLILLDIILPDMSGYDVCRKLKQNPKTGEIPVIFLTVLDEIEDVLKGFSLGAVDYITKPINEFEVIARVNTQLKLREANAELKELNHTKDKLFSIIAHEIKNPFANIINFTELLMENIEDFNKEKFKDLLKGIHVDALRSFELLENLLMWSRSQLKDKIKVNMQPILLKEVVDQVVSFKKESIWKKELKLINDIESTTMVFADKNMTETIIRNLVSNAIKFTTKGEIRLFCDTTNDYVDFFIKDTGIGIREENLNKLFNLNYFTTKGTFNEAGTGLGLIISKEFIEQMNGTISVESKPNEGTTFTVQFLKVK